MRVILLFFVFGCHGDRIQEILPDTTSSVPASVPVEDQSAGVMQMQSMVFQTVSQYSLNVKNVKDTAIILYGTKSWTFPRQDVNLTLTYPTTKKGGRPSVVDYLITAFKVTLYVSGVETRGYIIDGGIMQDEISISCISEGATSLSYQFWLYGTPKVLLNRTLDQI